MTGDNDDSGSADWPPKRSGRRRIGDGPTPDAGEVEPRAESAPEGAFSPDEATSGPEGDDPPPSERLELPGGIELQAAMRQAFDADDDSVDVLRGVQGKLRERSGGKFYGDGWSTLRHPPFATFFITSLMMLAILAIVYAILVPLVGDPVQLPEQPEPINVIPP
jgi:hypothetical protein